MRAAARRLRQDAGDPRAARSRGLDRVDGHPRLHGSGAGLLLRGRPADGLRRPLVGHPAGQRARRTRCHGDAADLLVPFMFAIWQGTVRAETVTEPFTIGIRVSGRNGGDYRVSVSSEGLTYEPGEIESLPALHRVRRGQPGAERLRPGQLRHGPRRHRPGRAVPEPVLPDLGRAEDPWPAARRPARSWLRSRRSTRRCRACPPRPCHRTHRTTLATAGSIRHPLIRRVVPRLGSGRPIVGLSVVLVGWVTDRQPVLGDPGRRGARQRVDRLPEPRHLERGEPCRGPARSSCEVEAAAGRRNDERLDLVLGQLRRHATTAHLEHVGMRHDRVLDLGRRQVLAAPPQHLLLARRRTCRCRPRSAVTRSPVCSQPSTTAAAVSSGISQ